MLRKIKKYKIGIRPSYATRLAKKKLVEGGVSVDEEALEREIEQETRSNETLLVPTALFDTLSKKDTPEALLKLWENAPSAKTLSISIIAATLGSPIEKAIEAARPQSEHKAVLMDALAKEALDQSVNFVYRLIGEEAKEDNCELSPLWPVEPSLIKPFLASLEAHKADISLDGEDRFSPLFSRVNFCFWVPASRR
jgi:hypothetical protein